jgi:hypothetical protein
MKQKSLFVVVMFLSLFILGIGFSSASILNGEYPLIAGQYDEVGTVYVHNDANYIYVNLVITDPDYAMSESHVHVGLVLGDFPLTKKGNPKVGNFDFSADHNPPVRDYTYTIPYSGAIVTEIKIAAHAVVSLGNPDLPNGVDDIVYATKRTNPNPLKCAIFKYDLSNDSDAQLGSELDEYANALAFDPVNGVLYFTRQSVAHANYEPSQFWSYDIINDTLTFLGNLPGNTLGGGFASGNPGSIVGASFYDGCYYYIQNFTTKLMKLDVASITKDGDDNITSMVEVADFSYFVSNRIYTFGDFAISPIGILYGSSQGNGTSITQFFFTYDILNNAYSDSYGAQAKNYQLAFGYDERLFGINYSGLSYVIDGDGNFLNSLAFTKGQYTTDMASGFYYPSGINETAWGQGESFPGNNWAMYFIYTLQQQ